MPQFSKEAVGQNQELLEAIGEIAAAHNATPAQISLAWMICKEPFVVPIPGTRKQSRLKENLGAADVILSPEEVRAIDQLLDSTPMSAVYGGAAVK